MKKNKQRVIKSIKTLSIFIMFLLLLSSCNEITTEIENSNVEIIEHISGIYEYGDSEYSAKVENNSLIIEKLNSNDLFPNNCIENKPSYRKQIISFYPLIASCILLDKLNPYIDTSINWDGNWILTDGKWMYARESGQNIIGFNERNLLLSDFTMIDMLTGEISRNNILNAQAKGEYNKVTQVGAATVSLNKRFFIFDHNANAVSEMSPDGIKTKIIDLPPSTYLGFVPYVDVMVASDNGEYLFLIVSETVRGPFDLYFYIVNVNSKSTIYRKRLEKKANYRNLYLQYKSGNVILGYKNNYKELIDFYWIKLKWK